MREILFKAKTEMIVDTYNCGKEDGEWVQGYLRCDCGKWLIYQFETDRADQVAYEVNPDTICQYTGLTDKNGNKIWENDVVKCNYNDYGEKGTYIGKVIFREDTCTFIVTNGKSTDYEWWNEEKEVIGNTFDNDCIDELLKGEEG